MTRPRPNNAGQASVELIAILPLAGLIALVVFSFLTARTANEQAGEAAEAAAIAMLQGNDPRDAATATIPSRLRHNARITIDGTHVTVHVVPRVPLPALADILAADAHADAAPRP